MKKILLPILLLSLCICISSFKHIEKLPPPISNPETARRLITGKAWKVVDVATISGSGKSYFEDEPTENEAVEIPDIESLRWLSIGQAKGSLSEFTNLFYNKCLEISIAFNRDSVAMTTGLEAAQQVFYISNNLEKHKPNGLNFTLSGERKSFADVGSDYFTATYYILGANKQYLYLLTPNKLNDLKVVFLLETK